MSSQRRHLASIGPPELGLEGGETFFPKQIAAALPPYASKPLTLVFPQRLVWCRAGILNPLCSLLKSANTKDLRLLNIGPGNSNRVTECNTCGCSLICMSSGGVCGICLVVIAKDAKDYLVLITVM